MCGLFLLQKNGGEGILEDRTVKIGYADYTIKKPLEIVQVGGEYYGIVDFDNHVIKIANKNKTHDKNKTFLHEVLHCICHRFSLQELNSNEQAIDLLATGIYEMLKDNPHMFIMEDI